MLGDHTFGSRGHHSVTWPGLSVSLVCPSSRLHSPWDGRIPTNGWGLPLEAEALSSQPVGRSAISGSIPVAPGEVVL